MNLNDYTFDELIKLKNDIDSHLYSFSDGFLYLCKVRSYGRNWTERPLNVYSLQELCYRYNGDDGIVDVYTTNPDLNIHNYGNVYYIKSEKDYESWKNWDWLNKSIPNMEQEIEEWETRDEVPFSRRPMFAPMYDREMIDMYKKELAEFDMNFVHPVLLNYREEE